MLGVDVLLAAAEVEVVRRGGGGRATAAVGSKLRVKKKVVKSSARVKQPAVSGRKGGGRVKKTCCNTNKNPNDGVGAVLAPVSGPNQSESLESVERLGSRIGEDCSRMGSISPIPQSPHCYYYGLNTLPQDILERSANFPSKARIESDTVGSFTTASVSMYKPAHSASMNDSLVLAREAFNAYWTSSSGCFFDPFFEACTVANRRALLRNTMAIQFAESHHQARSPYFSKPPCYRGPVLPRT
eukprot:CAMPEP_0185850900 /NCGR_PEP_ID=MMETSP1354-20130828/4849_1 /TAXON_ID=708628 /ORGANISM="Erythrolobus madagascarensis, Strain CCMP3276" /LENGTH=241 /DNA_ID=CAMNT_0028551627 /DNA_START=60 /DNA_END=785 /DNA_ORIENTATION=+